MSEAPIARVTDYFWKRETVRMEVLEGTIRAGDRLHVQGEFTDEVVTAEEMEVDDEPVEEVTEGDIFAMPLPMNQRVVLGDDVFPAEDGK